MYRTFNSGNRNNISGSNLNSQYEQQLNFQRNRPNQFGNSNRYYNDHTRQNSFDNKKHLIWEETDFPSFSHPEVWGPSFWLVLHISSLMYPANPSPNYKNRMKNFILGIPIMLPDEARKLKD